MKHYYHPRFIPDHQKRLLVDKEINYFLKHAPNSVNNLELGQENEVSVRLTSI